MPSRAEPPFGSESALGNENNDESDDDVKFLIYGDEEGESLNLNSIGNRKGGGLTSTGSATNVPSRTSGDSSTISVSELLKVGVGAVHKNTSAGGRTSSNKRGSQLLSNASNTIYIEHEDDRCSENPCKDMLMVWDDNPELRPWSRLLDVSPWFNYGFTEKTFKEYVIRQLGIRWERIKRQSIETSSDLLSSHQNPTTHAPSGVSNGFPNLCNNSLNMSYTSHDVGMMSKDANSGANGVIFCERAGEGGVVYDDSIHMNSGGVALNSVIAQSNAMLHHNATPGANVVPSPVPNFLPNVIYYPPPQGPVSIPVAQVPYPHSSYPVVHPNPYHQQHLFGGFPQPQSPPPHPSHLPLQAMQGHQVMQPGSRKAVSNNSGNNSGSSRGRKGFKE